MSRLPRFPQALLTVVGALALALTAGCSGGKPAAPPPVAAAKPAAPAVTPPAPAPVVTEAAATAAVATDAAATEAVATDAAAAETAAAAAPISAEAQNVFSTRCSVCHGSSGKGDGPGAMALNPKPRTYADAAWQASVTDEHLAKVIVEGGPSVGLSPLMTPSPDLKAKPEVVADLVRIIRGFKP